MAVNAVIRRVIRHDDGTATIVLAPQHNSGPPVTGSLPRLLVVNPPMSFEACAGTEVVIDGTVVYVGQTRWAERVGYGQLRLVAVRKE